LLRVQAHGCRGRDGRKRTAEGIEANGGGQPRRRRALQLQLLHLQLAVLLQRHSGRGVDVAFLLLLLLLLLLLQRARRLSGRGLPLRGLLLTGHLGVVDVLRRLHLGLGLRLLSLALRRCRALVVLRRGGGDGGRDGRFRGGLLSVPLVQLLLRLRALPPGCRGLFVG